MRFCADPLTHLPAALFLEETLRGLIATQTPFAFLHLDIDRFKSFNDAYGFIKGDHMLKTFGELLAESVLRVTGGDGFAAHIGGDHFAAVCAPEKAADLAHHIACRFDETAASLYKPEDRKHGYVETLDRTGKMTRQPIVTVRIGVATTASRPLSHYAKVIEIASELESWLKKKGSRLSRFAIDRRRS